MRSEGASATPHASGEISAFLPQAPVHIAVVAGESSGDLLAGQLIQAVQATGLATDFYGIAGPRMQAAGARSLFPMETLSVRGYVEALAGIHRILAIRRDLCRDLLAAPPRLFIGVDAPDFNLSLEARLKAAGIPTVHLVSPSIWAWRRGRIEKIRKAVSHMLLVFPFEEQIYREAGIPATYVGHPLAHSLPRPDRPAARHALGLRENGEYVALLPGSRQGEVKQHAGLFLDACRLIAGQRPGVEFLVPLATPETRRIFDTALQQRGAADLPIHRLDGQSHLVLQAADSGIVASGTATLEALLLGCPHVIAYRVPWLTYQIMKRQAYLPYVGLPNILAGRFLVPELLQKQATPDRLAGAVLGQLADPAARAAMAAEFAQLRGSLQRDTPHLIAQALAPFLA